MRGAKSLYEVSLFWTQRAGVLEPMGSEEIPVGWFLIRSS